MIDLPSFGNFITHEYENAKARVLAYYGDAPPFFGLTRYILKCDFNLWLVVVVKNAADNKAHYVPIKKHAWRLYIDSTDMESNQWKCEKVGGPVDPTKPTDGSKTTSTEVTPLQWKDQRPPPVKP